MSFLEVSGISKKNEKGYILQDISFTQQELKKVAISGETGSGKSTLLKIISGLVQPDAGKVIFDEKRVLGPAEQLVPGHPGIAYLSQQFELPEFLRVEQALRYANILIADEAQALYEICHISHLLERRTDQLSGGERQRVALARLLTSSPRLLLLDEPYSNLDTGHKKILKSVIQDIGEQLDITCLLISHDPLDTLSWADEILVLKDGLVQQQGTPQQIYRQPANEYTAGLFGSYNLIPAKQAHVFSNLPEVQSNGESILIRPEDFKLGNTDKQTVQGTVEKVTFFGSYYELGISISGTMITAKTASSDWCEGQHVEVSIAPEHVHYL